MKQQKGSVEYWQIECPHCGIITYYRFHKKVYTKSKWPLLICRCIKMFAFLESNLSKIRVCEKIPDNELRPLIRRQAEDVYEAD